MSSVDPVPSGRPLVVQKVAGVLCAVEALCLIGFAVFYVVELAAGAGSDRNQVLTSAALFVVMAAGLGYLARLWWAGSPWSATPTLVWHLVLLPVVIGLFQAGQVLIGLGVAVAVLLGLVSAVAGRRRDCVAEPERDVSAD